MQAMLVKSAPGTKRKWYIQVLDIKSSLVVSLSGWCIAVLAAKVGPVHLQMMGRDRYKISVEKIMSLPTNGAITPENRLNSVALSGVSANLPVLSYQGMRVVTTETLALGYGTDEGNIRTNLSRNIDRFEEGIHYFLLTGSELKVFKNRVANSNSVGSNARSLTLWTEKGAARMSKIVDTNQAWDFFEKLEDSYFNLREVYGVMLPNINDPIQLARAWGDAM